MPVQPERRPSHSPGGPARTGGGASARRVTIAIHGLTRDGDGTLAVEQSIVQTPGVVWALVNPLTEMAYVEYDPSRVRPEQLAAAVRQVGFKADAPSPR